MYAVKIKQVTFGLSYHIGCPVVRAYVRSRGNQKFTPDFLTHSSPDASVNDSYQLLNKFEQILWFVNGEYINSFKDAEGRGKWLIWATVKNHGLEGGFIPARKQDYLFHRSLFFPKIFTGPTHVPYTLQVNFLETFWKWEKNHEMVNITQRLFVQQNSSVFLFCICL